MIPGLPDTIANVIFNYVGYNPEKLTSVPSNVMKEISDSLLNSIKRVEEHEKRKAEEDPSAPPSKKHKP